MQDLRGDALIRHWDAQFQSDPLAARVVAGLSNRADEIWQRAFQLMQRESPEYRNSVDEDFTKESKTHCRELLEMIVAIAAGQVSKSNSDPFDFVRTHAEWRARRQVPLIASLHAYRLAHRTYSEFSRSSLSQHDEPGDIIRSLTMLSDFWLQLFDHVGAVLAEAHAVEDSLIVAQGTRSYAGLIGELLRGVQPSDPESQRLCALCGLRPGRPMAVAVVRPNLPEESADREVTLRSFVRLLEQAVRPATFGRLIDVRNHSEVIVIASSDSDTARGLMQALRHSGFAERTGTGQAVRVGVSLDTADFASLPQALEDAQTALEFADAAQPLMHFLDVDLPELLIRRAGGAAVRLIPDWARHFSSTDDGQARALSRTIRMFADCSFNVKQTAHHLDIHPNTVYFRLNRIKKLTGIDPRTYSGASRFLTSLRLLEIHGDA